MMPLTQQDISSSDVWNMLLQINRRLIALEKAFQIKDDYGEEAVETPSGGGSVEAGGREIHLAGREMTPEELAAFGMEPDPTLEECIADARLHREERLVALANVAGSLWDGKRTREQVMADAVAEVRKMRDEWDD
jgi:hypothetical protein